MMNKTTRVAHRSSIHLFLAAVGMTSGIAGLFLPFTYDYSPVSALDAELWRLAAPFFLCIPIAGVSIRLAATGSLARPEMWIAYIASTAMALVTLSIYGEVDSWPRGLQEWLAFGVPPITLLVGLRAVIKKARLASLTGMSAVMAMQAAYLSNSLLCLIGFLGNWQIGAYFALITSAAYLVQITMP